MVFYSGASRKGLGRDDILSGALSVLLKYSEINKFYGWDPYDTLKSWFPFWWFGKWGPVLAIQFQKRNPINIRPLIGVRKGRNPKAIGLFLRSLSTLYRNDPRPEYLHHMRELFAWLRGNPSKGYSAYCWGYDFPWASPVKYMDAYVPSVVATGFVVKGIFEYWQALGKEVEQDVLDVLEGAVHFVLNHLERHEDSSGICISYTPVMKDACYNASLLGAEILARYLLLCDERNTSVTPSRPPQAADSGRPTRGDDVAGLIERVVDFVVARQLPDGRWNYSIDLESGKERVQIDFHQGYVIESIEEIMRLTGKRKPEWEEAVRKGLEYYRKVQFFDDGRSLWRIPKQWPVEIHNQAQGIVTFSMFEEYRDFAHTIAEWTIKNMQDRKGYFYYQKFSWYTNNISYMRWSNAWMAVALSKLNCTTRLRFASAWHAWDTGNTESSS